MSKGLYKSDLCRYSPCSLITINNNNSKIENIYHVKKITFLHRTVLFLFNLVTHIVTAIAQYTNGPAISSKNLDPAALFKRAKLTLSLNIHLEKLEKF